MTDEQATEALVGKPRGKLINWMSDEVSSEVTKALEKGSRQLKQAQAIRDQIDAEENQKIQDEAAEASS